MVLPKGGVEDAAAYVGDNSEQTRLWFSVLGGDRSVDCSVGILPRPAKVAAICTDLKGTVVFYLLSSEPVRVGRLILVRTAA